MNSQIHKKYTSCKIQNKLGKRGYCPFRKGKETYASKLPTHYLWPKSIGHLDSYTAKF